MITIGDASLLDDCLLIVVIAHALSGVQFGLKSNVITKSHDRKAGVRFVITSLISDQIARHEVQFPLYYIRFEIYKRQS